VKPTKVLTLFGWVVPAATAGYLGSKLITANGGQVPVTPLNLILTLAAISIILAGFATPMLRYRRALAEQLKNSAAPRPKRLNPFYAVRLLLLAKATAISGALFVGWHLGVIWMQLSSPVTTQSIWQNAAALIASIVMVVVGVVIERICRIKDDGSDSIEGSESSTSSAKISGPEGAAGRVSGPAREIAGEGKAR
jgi:Protein of unknown function (DUF3180)